MLRIDRPIEAIAVIGSMEHNLHRINGIKKTHEKERSESKTPTFALTR